MIAVKSSLVEYKELLDSRLEGFDADSFVNADPLSIVYTLRAKLQRDDSYVKHIEIGALFVAMIAWGNRKMIRSNATKLMELMNWEPYRFLMNGDFESLPDGRCIHRTLFGKAFKEVCRALRDLYGKYESLEEYVLQGRGVSGGYVEQLAKITAPARLGSVSGKSACKRLCMYLRWMVRTGVPDLGLWSSISEGELYAVLDVHVVREARSRGLISGATANWRAVEELTSHYREWSECDPLKYDVVMMLNDL
ncbi:MAG: DUF2400 domain-containing protein [Marinifilaceae bacterium]|nr:DUF2400 domain-containing protein [Marinifilaceae bacterium]